MLSYFKKIVAKIKKRFTSDHKVISNYNNDFSKLEGKSVKIYGDGYVWDCLVAVIEREIGITLVDKDDKSPTSCYIRKDVLKDYTEDKYNKDFDSFVLGIVHGSILVESTIEYHPKQEMYEICPFN